MKLLLTSSGMENSRLGEKMIELAEKLGIKTSLFKNNKGFVKEIKKMGIECNY